MSVVPSKSGSTGTSGPKAVSPSVNGWQAEYLEAEYRRFQSDPGSVPPDLQSFFRGFDLALGGGVPAAPGTESPFQSAVDELIAAYREVGHLAAKLDPFGRERPRPAALTLAHYGLSDSDLEKRVEASLAGVSATPTLREVIEHLEATYCGSVGLEFAHVQDSTERAWFLANFEQRRGAAPLTAEDRVRVLHQLTASETFERFLAKRYQGAKRFSAEGGESLLPLLKFMTEQAGLSGVKEVVLGMAHRARVNVLKNYLGKDVERIFTEFEDAWTEGYDSGGDVKYHRGYSGDQALPNGGIVHLSMANNPSHLESVNAVVMGRCRAKQDLAGDADGRRVVALLIHGDAAIAGQGVVAECLNMMGLEGYRVGGTLHVVINNLVGFTTDPEDGRSTTYCTDVAKMINAPVFHVNGDDPDAVVAVARLAVDYRQQFRKDVFVDLWCYRKYGHNESDEAAYTQPILAALIRKQPSPLENYRKRLVAANVLSDEAAQAVVDAEWDKLDKAQAAARQKPVKPVPPPGGGEWHGFQGKYSFDSPKTAISSGVLEEVCAALGRTPPGFNVHPKLKGLLAARAALPTSRQLCHADAEMIAIGSLLLDATPVRLSGQDSRRGTFTQRHAVLRDEQTGELYIPVDHIRELGLPASATPPGSIGADGRPRQAKLSVWDSPLSEFSVMGFDYGYSRASPRTLVMWEAQFGDFVNSAQVLIDQYLASSESKWDRWAGLVLLLPHGYEGQGPEHSSARLERFLQLCSEQNMEVAYPSTAAQMFHLLRRQQKRDFRKPLVLLTPKKYLRENTSTVDELIEGQFQHLIDDPAFTGKGAQDAGSVKTIAFCTGKVFYALAERRAAIGRTDLAIVRIEQLYPLHLKQLSAILARYSRASQHLWVQEEPRNQGAFISISDRFRTELSIELSYVGRDASASPAVGSYSVHNRQQEAILSAAVGPAPKGGGKAGAAPLESRPAPVKDSSMKASA